METKTRIALIFAAYFFWFFVTGFVISRTRRSYSWKRNFAISGAVMGWLAGCVFAWPDYVRLAGNTLLYLVSAYLILGGPLKSVWIKSKTKKE